MPNATASAHEVLQSKWYEWTRIKYHSSVLKLTFERDLRKVQKQTFMFVSGFGNILALLKIISDDQLYSILRVFYVFTKQVLPDLPLLIPYLKLHQEFTIFYWVDTITCIYLYDQVR